MSIHARADSRRHDVYDICVGSVLGSMVAFFSYRRYYPRLRSQRCGEPFPSRAQTFNADFLKVRGDEEHWRDLREELELEDRENESG